MSTEHSRQVAVIGGGNFGSCLALHLGRCGHQVTLWDRDPQLTATLNQTRHHPQVLGSFEFPSNIQATSDVDQLPFDSLHSLVISVPTQFIRVTLERFRNKIRPGTYIVCASKGIEQTTNIFPSTIIRECLGEEVASYKTTLSGPSFAIEVARKLPTAVSIAAAERAHAVAVQKVFHAPCFRAYTSTDPLGLEICGALKNVMAIAAGASHGLGFEANSSAALVTRALAEMTRIGLAMGAQEQTFRSLGGVGDLFLTCSSQKSRNFQVGYQIARGASLADTLRDIGSVAEGVTTTPSAYTLAQELQVRAPVISAVYDVLYNHKNVEEVLFQLLERDAGDEFTREVTS
ncbi:MAG: NAD(P)-dependent glycerol-3-phosphate dehydrogenase [Zetaproteobacteria bacterium]|nr:NAD(P)-dependent glycerol-3-phosphate dehydrogenase [Zetaproteobacteria bacterium]